MRACAGPCVGAVAHTDGAAHRERGWPLWGRGGDAILQYQVREGGINNEAPGFKPPAAKPMDVYIRLARKGKTFTTWWKTKEKDEWLEVEPTKTLDLKDPIEIGIYAGNCEGVGKGDIQYEYFKENAVYCEPENIDSIKILNMKKNKLKESIDDFSVVASIKN